MASRLDSLELLLSCVVCLEEFEESGDHIPRLLPCTHTLCEACIKQLIQNDKLECPECRAKHNAPRDEKSFPQNKYLLIQVKRKPSKKSKGKKEQDEKKLCKVHGKELVLFCDEPECKKSICLVCLKKFHKKHDVIDEKRGVLMRNISCIEQNLKEKIVVLHATEDDVSRKTEDCLKDLEKRREEMKDEIDKQFDIMKKEAEDRKKEVKNVLDSDVQGLNENLNLLSNIRKNTEAMDDDNDDNYRIETVNGIKEIVNEYLSGNRTYKYPELSPTPQEPMEFGQIEEKQLNIKLLEIDENDSMESPLRNITDTSQLKCTGELNVST